MASGPPPLSVVILTFNEERNLPSCLASLEKLSCKLFVVDSGSTDQTVALASRAGACIVSHPFEHYAAQRNWAQEHLSIRTPWTLHLDADERLTPALVDEINRVLVDARPRVAGYLLRKRTVFMGRWIRHGGHYPSYHLRLFRTGRGSCEDRLYDQHFLVHGPIERLQNDYIDVVTDDLSTWLTRHVRWAELEARELLRERASQTGRVQPVLFGSPIQRRRWLRDKLYARSPLFTRSFLYWVYRYFVRFGFLDGPEGLIFHFLHAFWYRFIIDVKLYEMRSNQVESAAS